MFAIMCGSIRVTSTSQRAAPQKPPQPDPARTTRSTLCRLLCSSMEHKPLSLTLPSSLLSTGHKPLSMMVGCRRQVGQEEPPSLPAPSHTTAEPPRTAAEPPLEAVREGASDRERPSATRLTFSVTRPPADISVIKYRGRGSAAVRS